MISVELSGVTIIPLGNFDVLSHLAGGALGGDQRDDPGLGAAPPKKSKPAPLR